MVVWVIQFLFKLLGGVIMRFVKYNCCHCGKVLAVGQLNGIIKCKKCGRPVQLPAKEIATA